MGARITRRMEQLEKGLAVDLLASVDCTSSVFR